MRRKLSAAAIGIGIAPILALTMPALTANAHGWISDPPSRQAQCATGVVTDCGDIQYEPQSVEGPKGLSSCSGGNARFAQLDDESKPWVATPVSTNVTFHWKFTAMHKTTDWEYFIGGTKVATIPGNDAQPPAEVDHQVSLSGHSGRQKVLAVWNIADTGNAFYSCIDLQVG